MKKFIIVLIVLFFPMAYSPAQENSTEPKETVETVEDIKKESKEDIEKIKKETESNKDELIKNEEKDNKKEDENVEEKKNESPNDEVQKEDPTEKTQTLVSSSGKKGERLWMSGYFAPVVRFSQMNGYKGSEYGTFVGYKGAFIIEGFAIGGGLFINAAKKSRYADGKNRDIYMGYTGLLLEYNFFRKKLINFSLGTLVAYGSAGFFRKVKHYDAYGYYDEDTEFDGTEFFVLEPEVVLYLNITRFFRLGFGGSYRYIYGLKKYELNNNSYSGFSGSLIFQFGWF